MDVEKFQNMWKETETRRAKGTGKHTQQRIGNAQVVTHTRENSQNYGANRSGIEEKLAFKCLNIKKKCFQQLARSLRLDWVQTVGGQLSPGDWEVSAICGTDFITPPIVDVCSLLVCSITQLHPHPVWISTGPVGTVRRAALQSPEGT